MDKQTILQVVSKVTGVPIEDILSGNAMRGTRKKEIVFARYLSIAFCRLYQTGSIAEIMSFHNRDRSQYYHSLKTLKNDIEQSDVKWFTYSDVWTRLHKIEPIPVKRELPIPTTDDFSDDEYQDLTSEALKFQTNI